MFANISVGRQIFVSIHTLSILCVVFIIGSVVDAAPDLVVDTSTSVSTNTAFVGDPITVNIKIRNAGPDVAHVVGSTVGIYTDHSNPPGYQTTPEFEMFLPNFSTINSGQVIAFTATVSYDTDGEKTLWVYIDRNRVVAESDENNNAGPSGGIPVSITVLGDPEIYVYAGPSGEIPDGGGFVLDDTDVGSPVSQWVSIRNEGSGPLTIGTVSVTGDFSITEQPPSVIEAGTIRGFELQFDASVGGVESGTVLFSTNDGDENPYNFSVQGTAISAEPEIRVLLGSNEVTSYSGNHLPIAVLDEVVDIQITVFNDGDTTLLITNATAGGPFTITGSSLNSVSAGSFGLMTLHVDTGELGSLFGIVSIGNNDANENPFEFVVEGLVVDGQLCESTELDHLIDLEYWIGSDVAASGTTGVVGSDNGAAFVGSLENGQVASIEPLLVPGGNPPSFGRSVAIEGDLIVVGSPISQWEPGGNSPVYVFRYNGLDWVYEDELLPMDGSVDTRYGSSVAVDGDYIFVGAMESDTGAIDRGDVHVYHFNGVTWESQGTLAHPFFVEGDQFGAAMAADSGVLIVGATKYFPGNLNGSAYVYRLIGNQWVYEAELFPAGFGNVFGWYGWDVDISGDRVIVGAYAADSAFIFKNDGSQWIEESRLASFDPRWEDWFGDSVSIDGDVVIVGAPDVASARQGKAYVFGFNGTEWVSKSLIEVDSQSPEFMPGFGTSVALEGGVVLIGAPGDLEGASVYVFDVCDGGQGGCDLAAEFVEFSGLVYNFGDQLTVQAQVCSNEIDACSDPFGVILRLVGNDPDEGLVEIELGAEIIQAPPAGVQCRSFNIPVTLPPQSSLSPGKYSIEMEIASGGGSNTQNDVVSKPIELTTTGAGAVTILFHGLRPSGDNGGTIPWTSGASPVRDYWNREKETTRSLLMAEGPGRVLVHNAGASGGSLDPVFIEESPTDFAVIPQGYHDPFNGHSIIVDDWLAVSNDPHAGEAESAAERFFAAMVLEGFLDLDNPSNSVKMHVIGHSRGASVASEFVQRCAVYGVQISYLTYLDPHDFNEDDIIIDDKFKDPAPQVWDNVDYADCFYQVCGQNTQWPIPSLVPSGRPIAGIIQSWPYQLNLSDRAFMDCNTNDSNFGVDSPHSLVIEWYLTTIHGDIPSDRTNWDYGNVDPDIGYRFWKNKTGFQWTNPDKFGKVNPVHPVTLAGLAAYPDPFGTSYDFTEDMQSVRFYVGNFELDDLDDHEIAGWWYPEMNNWHIREQGTRKLHLLNGNSVLKYHRFSRETAPLVRNPSVIPPNAEALTFMFGVGWPSSSSSLRVTISNGFVNNHVIGDLDCSELQTLLRPESLDIPESFRGKRAWFEFSFINTNNTDFETVYFDDFGFDEVLVAECQADLNGDGMLNFFDVSMFLVAYGEQDPVADFLEDGVWNFFDVSEFLIAYGQGCP